MSALIVCHLLRFTACRYAGADARTFRAAMQPHFKPAVDAAELAAGIRSSWLTARCDDAFEIGRCSGRHEWLQWWYAYDHPNVEWPGGAGAAAVHRSTASDQQCSGSVGPAAAVSGHS